MPIARAPFVAALAFLGAFLVAFLGACGSAPPPGLYSPAASATTTTNAPGPSAASTSSAPPAPAVVWAPFTYADCGVTLPMPGTPKTSTDEVDTSAVKRTIHSATSDLGDRAAIVSCSDVPAYPSSDDMLDRARDGAVASMKGTLEASKNVTVDGFPGRDVTLSVQDKKLSVRLVLAKQRLFTLVALGFTADETQRFIDGFAIDAKH